MLLVSGNPEDVGQLREKNLYNCKEIGFISHRPFITVNSQLHVS